MAGKKLVTMIEIAMMAAIAIVLHKLMIPFHLWPNGGSVTFSMVPIAAVAFRRGAKAGSFAEESPGCCYGCWEAL